MHLTSLPGGNPSSCRGRKEPKTSLAPRGLQIRARPCLGLSCTHIPVGGFQSLPLLRPHGFCLLCLPFAAADSSLRGPNHGVCVYVVNFGVLDLGVCTLEGIQSWCLRRQVDVVSFLFFFFFLGGRGLQILVFVRGWLVLEGSHSWCLYDVGCFEYQTL